MSAQDKTALIFLPGLSTANNVTDVSGRGVGMDVVKTNLDRLGGKVEIVSVIGSGTTFRIKLPLTLAIIPALIFSVEGRTLCDSANQCGGAAAGAARGPRPVSKSWATLRCCCCATGLSRWCVSPICWALLPTYADRIRGQQEVDRRTRLADRRSPRTLPAAAGSGSEIVHRRTAFSAMLRAQRADRRQNAAGRWRLPWSRPGPRLTDWWWERFHDTEEIVVKPLGCHLKRLVEYAGATILGDGTVALDPGRRADWRQRPTWARFPAPRVLTQLSEAAQLEKLTDTHALLLFHNAPEELCAIPLDTVLRIEHIRPQQVETGAGAARCNTAAASCRWSRCPTAPRSIRLATARTSR